MTKIWKAAAAVGCTAVMVIGLSACDFSLFGNNSKSAYQVAVENGFQGSEEDWLKSLHGADGKDGGDLDIEEIYAAAAKNGYEGSFLEFLKEYLSADINEDNNTDAIAHNLMSSVKIYSAFGNTVRVGGGPLATTKTTYAIAQGSGVIYDLNRDAGNAIIITNYHVVYDYESDNGVADSIDLYLYGGLDGYSVTRNYSGEVTAYSAGGSSIHATFVGGASEYDIAVLEVQGSEVLRNSSAEEAVVGSSDAVAAGEKVFAVGNAEGEGISVTSGAISVDSEYITIQSILGETDSSGNLKEISYRVMRTDAAINSGNSGGGLYDAQGKLIGITNAKQMDTPNKDGSIHSVDNMGYALPITQVVGVVENVLANGGTVKRATLGVTVQTVDSKSVLSGGKAVIVETVSVSEITKGSLAASAFKVNDIVKSVTIGDTTTKILRNYQIRDLLLNVRKGDTVTVTVERGGEEKALSLTFDQDKYFTAVA